MDDECLLLSIHDTNALRWIFLDERSGGSREAIAAGCSVAASLLRNGINDSNLKPGADDRAFGFSRDRIDRGDGHLFHTVFRRNIPLSGDKPSSTHDTHACEVRELFKRERFGREKDDTFFRRVCARRQFGTLDLQRVVFTATGGPRREGF